MFKELQAFGVTAVDSLVKKSSQEEVGWREVWDLGGQGRSLAMRQQKKSCNKAFAVFAVRVVSPCCCKGQSGLFTCTHSKDFDGFPQ